METAVPVMVPKPLESTLPFGVAPHRVVQDVEGFQPELQHMPLEIRHAELFVRREVERQIAGPISELRPTLPKVPGAFGLKAARLYHRPMESGRQIGTDAGGIGAVEEPRRCRSGPRRRWWA